MKRKMALRGMSDAETNEEFFNWIDKNRDFPIESY